MRDILLVEMYLTAESALVAAVDAAGGTVSLPDGRTVSVGRAEFDALPSVRRKRAGGDDTEECADALEAMSA